jgi:hypothetical protein
MKFCPGRQARPCRPSRRSSRRPVAAGDVLRLPLRGDPQRHKYPSSWAARVRLAKMAVGGAVSLTAGTKRLSRSKLPAQRRTPRPGHRSRSPGARRGPEGHRAAHRYRNSRRQVLPGHAGRVCRVRDQSASRATTRGHRQGEGGGRLQGAAAFDRGLAGACIEGAGHVRPIGFLSALL